MLPDEVAVILCELPTCQFSPPFGDVTVTVGIGCEIVKFASLTSATLPVAYNTVALTLQVVEGAWGTVHETLIVVFGVDIPVSQSQRDPPSAGNLNTQPTADRVGIGLPECPHRIRRSMFHGPSQTRLRRPARSGRPYCMPMAVWRMLVMRIAQFRNRYQRSRLRRQTAGRIGKLAVRTISRQLHREASPVSKSIIRRMADHHGLTSRAIHHSIIRSMFHGRFQIRLQRQPK